MVAAVRFGVERFRINRFNTGFGLQAVRFQDGSVCKQSGFETYFSVCPGGACGLAVLELRFPNRVVDGFGFGSVLIETARGSVLALRFRFPVPGSVFGHPAIFPKQP